MPESKKQKYFFAEECAKIRLLLKTDANLELFLITRITTFEPIPHSFFYTFVIPVGFWFVHSDKERKMG